MSGGHPSFGCVASGLLMFLVDAGFAVLVFSIADLRTSERHARHSEEVPGDCIPRVKPQHAG
jgi:hypothetical protein